MLPHTLGTFAARGICALLRLPDEVLMRRAACIDIGTNSVLLLIAEGEAENPRPLLERMTITRLGQGVDRTRALAPEAVERTLACLGDYAALLEAYGVRDAEHLDVVGTSALRDARGAEPLLAAAEALLGKSPRVLSGEEEALASFEGALGGLPIAPGPVVVIDIGGGSTELICGQRLESGELRVEAACSIDLGAVRATERHLHCDPPETGELDALRAEAAEQLASSAAAIRPPRGTPIVGVAGTVTTLAAWRGGVVPYDSARIHGSTLSDEELRLAIDELRPLSASERAALPGVEPKRADVLLGGALVLEASLRHLRRGGGPRATGRGLWPQLLVSDRGLRWGCVRRLLRRASAAPDARGG